MRAFLVGILASASYLGLSGCSSVDAGAGGAPSDAVVTVAAATDVRPVLDPLIADLGANGVDIVVSYGSSGQLARQIEAGADFDVFLSANAAFAEQVAGADHQPIRYALGRLAVWSPTATSVAELADPRFAHVAIANPDHAPYGAAARQALTAAGVWEAVQRRLVLGDNATDAMRLATSGNADAAIVPRSLAIAEPSGAWTEVDRVLHEPLSQTAVVFNAEPGTLRLIEVLTGDVGRAALAAGGFDLPVG